MRSDTRLAIVTGTSSGLGFAIARQLLANGWTVLGLSRRSPELTHADYRHFEIDLANLERLKQIAERELSPTIQEGRWQRIGLVNNAGAIGSLLAIEQTDPIYAADVFAVNAIAPIYLMGFVARVAPAATALRIVNVSTGAAVQPAPGCGDYGSSKAALRHAGTILAAELASEERPGGPRPNAAILSYAPGVVDTPMQETARSSEGPWNRRFVEFYERGLLQPAEAPAREIVNFLAGEDAEAFSERRFGAR